MPNIAPTKPDTVTVSRDVAFIVILSLAAAWIDNLRDVTGWHWLVILSATACTVALFKTIVYVAKSALKSKSSL